MKWRRKKVYSESSSSSRNSLISRVFPVSWLSKFKQKSVDVEAKPVKVKQNSVFVGSRRCVDGGRGGGLYGGEGETFWRLSFDEEGDPRKTSRGDLSSNWYDSGDKLGVPTSVLSGANAMTLKGNEEIRKFNNLNLDAKKMKEQQRNVEILPEMEIFKTEEEAITKTLGLTTKKELKLKKTNQRFQKEAEERSRKSVENDKLRFESIPEIGRENCKLIRADMKKPRHISSTYLRNSKLTTIEEDGALSVPNNLDGNHGISAEEWERLKEMKIREIKSKGESHRKSPYIGRELQTRKTKQNSKIRVVSPRIKALEDMKKAKLKMKKRKENTTDGRTSLESFAVVKCSFDPQKDFRDSMMEMILERRFSQPEELEELLACYLTLNSDIYHDLIVKVFRQVWFELNEACFVDLQNEHDCYN